MNSQESHVTLGRRHYRSQLSRQLMAQYLLSLIGYALTLAGLALLSWQICHRITWYAGDPLYQLLSWVRDYILLVGGGALLLGWTAITYYFFTKPLRYLDELVDASQQLAHPGEAPVTLPPAMKNVEDQLNLVRQQALRDAQAVREAEQRKNDLIVYLAHDLKTPLTSVIGYLTLLRDEPRLSLELRGRYTGIALDKAQRLEELINEFFEITRFNLSRLELELVPVDLSRMLQQVVSEFEPMLAQKGLGCRMDLPPTLEYRCDPDKLARVFDNLLRNACHYSFPDSCIAISALAAGGDIVLTFTNAGPTIPPEKLSRIFEQFFRLDASRATSTGGAGLGLAIAREIVQLHGGTIRAESAQEQIVFTVTLPQREP